MRHQFRTEWHHHGFWILAWLLWVLLQREWRAGLLNDDNLFSSLMGDDLAILITPLLAATVTWRCVSADSPSNTDSAVLTRPIGQAALWTGKAAFLGAGLLLPFLASAMTEWPGFDHGGFMWLALVLGLLLVAWMIISLVGAVTSLAGSSRQLMAILVLGVLAAGAWLLLGGSFMADVQPSPSKDPTAGSARTCGVICAMALACMGALAAWWTATVPRRRGRAAALLLLSLLQAPVVTATWKADWITPPPLAYPPGRLGVKTGRADPADKAPGRALWPTLRITGLGKDEVASIIDLAPVLEGREDWPPLGSYTDMGLNTTGYDSWLHFDHARALLKHSPPATLWQQSLNNQRLSSARDKVQNAIKPLRLDPQAMPARWRLRLAVHQMRRVATLPFQKLWTQDNTFIVRPGLRLECPPFVFKHYSWEMSGRVRSLHSLLLPGREHAPAVAGGRPLPDGFFLVLEDPELRENATHAFLLSRHGGQSVGHGLAVDESLSFTVRLWEPTVQHHLLETTHENWLRRLNASFWHAEERGTIDLEITAAQMAEVLAEPQPQAKKP